MEKIFEDVLAEQTSAKKLKIEIGVDKQSLVDLVNEFINDTQVQKTLAKLIKSAVKN